MHDNATQTVVNIINNTKASCLVFTVGRCGEGRVLSPSKATCEDEDVCVWRPCLNGGSCFNKPSGMTALSVWCCEYIHTVPFYFGVFAILYLAQLIVLWPWLLSFEYSVTHDQLKSYC